MYLFIEVLPSGNWFVQSESLVIEGGNVFLAKRCRARSPPKHARELSVEADMEVPFLLEEMLS